MFATLLGKILITFSRESVDIPWKKCALSGTVINLCIITYNNAVMYASFPAVVMAKSCSLLSVIVVGVFFSQVRDQELKLSRNKIFIGLVATTGIIIFNYFKHNEKDNVDKPISIFSFSSLFLLISLIGDGILPEIQAQIKSEYKPSSIDMFYHINKFTCLIGICLALITTRITVIIDFLLHYEGFVFDVIFMSILNGSGQLFIYRMIKEFKQHIAPFVIAFRKCITVLINILWFHHLVNWEQMFGIGFVFVAVMWEVWSNYRDNLRKEEEKKKSTTDELDETQRILDSIDRELTKLP